MGTKKLELFPSPPVMAWIPKEKHVFYKKYPWNQRRRRDETNRVLFYPQNR